MGSRLEEWAGAGVTLLDGAMGTELQGRGLPLGGCPEAWNLERPEQVAEVHRAYVEAGSQVILANTFGANRINLHARGLGDSVREVIQASVTLARAAAQDRAAVAGSIGPLNRQALRDAPKRGAPAEAASAALAEQAACLVEAGAELLVVETMTSVYDAEQALEACRATGLPAVISFSYPAYLRGDLQPEVTARAMERAGAYAIGANCGYGPGEFPEIARRYAASCALPIWLKPSAGLPRIEAGRPVYSLTPAEFAEESARLAESGGRFIGGCCGIGPAHIAAAGGLLRR